MRLTVILILLSFNACSQGILGVDVSGILPSHPTGLTWTKVQEERYLNLVDENHVHYTSDFTSSTSNLSAVSGSAPSISGGNLVITGSVKYKSTSTSVASWNTTEINIAAMGSISDTNKLGACFIKDATHYIAGVYEKTAGRLQIIQNDVILQTLPYSLNTNNLKIFLVISGNSISIWYQESGGDVTCGFSSTSTVDLKALTISDYKFGVYCLQTGTTHNVTSLRGSASGGVSFFNIKLARHKSDGSEVIIGGRLFATADLTNISSLGSSSYVEANSVFISIDTASFNDIQIEGRFYFDRSSKRLGGQDLHALLNEGSNEWEITYVPVDNSGALDGGVDLFFNLDSADIFTEVVIAAADLTAMDFNGVSDVYDVSSRFIGGVYKSAVTKGFGTGRAWLFSGSALDDMTLVDSYDDGTFYECSSWVRYRGVWYLTYATFGDTKQIVLSYPGMNKIGYFNLPFATDPQGRIPGYEWYCKQTNGKTTYYLLGFDTEEFEATVPIYGLTIFPWTMGNFVVWKATEQKNGYEF